MFSRGSNVIPTISLLLATACWGLGVVLSKRALDHIPPLTLLVTQLTASLVVLWLALRLRRVAVTWSKELIPATLLGWLNPGVSYTLSLLGLALTTASMSALLWAMEPLLIVGLAWLLLRERLTIRFLLLCGLALGGTVLVVGTGFGGSGQMVGNALIFGGVACCALYTVLARRWGEGIRPLLAVALQQSLALGWAAIIWPAELWRIGLGSVTEIPAEAWLLAAVSGVIYYGLAFWFYLDGLQRLPASEAGLFINLVPLFALGGAYLLLGETLRPVQWLGSGLVLAAVVSLSLGPGFSRTQGAR
jgi:drug/metabolite transporter (DMT)-like permease